MLHDRQDACDDGAIIRVFPRPGSDQEKYDEKRESDENEGEQEYGDTSFCDNHDCEMSSPVG